ncbi:MAG: formyltetrahydrofolate deformylase [Deltaproteobacteria bacterium]
MIESPVPLILLFTCRDQKGIVAAVTDSVFRSGGNIISAEQHSTDPSNGRFFLRIVFYPGEGTGVKEFAGGFAAVADRFKAEWHVFDSREKMRMGILVSRPDHCLFDLLYLWRSGELNVEVPFVLSNCESHRQIVSQFGVPFYFIPANAANRMEDHILALVKGASDLLVLARYMLTLSRGFLDSYGKDIINIHHGFLPSFKGARPYHQAYERGVKVIGATAHFVTEKLDEGPIICQKVESVSHRDDVPALTRKGKNLEKHALSSAVLAYTSHRVIRFGSKTIVF